MARKGTTDEEQARIDAEVGAPGKAEVSAAVCELCGGPEDPGVADDQKMDAGGSGHNLHPRCRPEWVRRQKERADAMGVTADEHKFAASVPSSNR